MSARENILQKIKQALEKPVPVPFDRTIESEKVFVQGAEDDALRIRGAGAIYARGDISDLYFRGRDNSTVRIGHCTRDRSRRCRVGDRANDRYRLRIILSLLGQDVDDLH